MWCGWGERGGGWVRDGSYLFKMVTFINMVITGIENGSPDMILTAFEGKFHEKKTGIPPGVHRPPYASNFSILGI